MTQAPNPAWGQQPDPGRVLIVEDDPGVRESLEAIVSADWAVETAGSVREATKALKARRFDAVITDFNLGDGTGAAIIETCQVHCPLAAVILLTGDIGRADVRDLNRAGRTLVLLKPVNPVELMAWVKNGITMARLSATRKEITARSTPVPGRALTPLPPRDPGSGRFPS